MKKNTKKKATKSMIKETIRGKEIIDTKANKSLYSTLNAEDFPCFAALMSAGFELPDLQCKVDFKPYSRSKNGLSIYFSYRFDGCGEFIPMETIHIKDIEDGLEAWVLTEISYACVKESPKFYNSLIKTLSHGECMMKQLEKFIAMFDGILDLT